MKFKTKLAITFLTISLLPILLSLLAFLAIGTALVWTSDQKYGMETADYSMMSDSIDAFSRRTDELFNRILQQTDTDPALLEDREYLNTLNQVALENSSYIIVRRGDGIYYTGNTEAAEGLSGKNLPKDWVFLFMTTNSSPLPQRKRA